MKKFEDRTMCKLAKKELIENNLPEFYKLVNNPKFVCKKCGAVANNENNLCKSLELSKGK
jgi:hypothetical protein